MAVELVSSWNRMYKFLGSRNTKRIGRFDHSDLQEARDFASTMQPEYGNVGIIMRNGPGDWLIVVKGKKNIDMP